MQFIKKEPFVFVFFFSWAVLIRFALFPFLNDDLNHFLLPWYAFIQSHHGFPALEFAFSNYSPAYPTLLVIASYIKFIPPLVSIKLISVIFDLLVAWLAGLIVFKLTRSVPKRLIATLVVLFSPVIILNSSLWGQCDSIYTFWLLLSFYCLISDKPVYAVLSFGMAFAFKFQAMFFAPLLLTYYLKTCQNLLHLLLTPIPYLITAIPTVLAGRPLKDVLLIYLHQTDYYQSLTMHATNFYVYFSNNYYEIVMPAGLLATSFAFLILIALVIFSKRQPTPLFWLTYTPLFLFLAPMILPKMHDRYFYAAAVFMLVLMVTEWKAWYLAVVLQLTSVLTYSYFFTADHQGVLPIEMVAFLQIALLIALTVFVQQRYGLFDPMIHEYLYGGREADETLPQH